MKRIYIKTWAQLKPYNSTSITDTYYLGIANRIYRVLQTEYDFVLNMYLEKKELEMLSCFLASYFEDIISQTNVWGSFVKKHRELYGKNLPFYELDDYYEEEINLQDIVFLIWYFMNTVQHEMFISPHNTFMFQIADRVMEILEDEYEYAPENRILKNFYTLDETETDYYEIRNFIDTVLFKTYLFFPDTGLKLIWGEAELVEEVDENLLGYLQEMRDDMVHQSHTSLLGLQGKQWAAVILWEHPLKDDFLAMSPRLNGFFLYKGQDEEYVYLEHIASGRKFELLKCSFNSHEELTETDTIVYLGMVRWKNQWWFSGISFSKEFDADLVLDEKNSISSRMRVNFLEEDADIIEDVLRKQQAAFLNFNKGAPIAFLKPYEIDTFVNEFQLQYQKDLGLSTEEIKNAHERGKKEGFLGGEHNDNKNNFGDDFEVATCFFNPNSGIELAMDVCHAFPVANNPYFEKSKSEDDIMEVLINPEISTELAEYCIELAKDKLPFFKDGKGALFFEDMDFLLRFWKKENYFTKPNISLTGRSK
ncbi:MAG: DUF3843 family protein [Aequorivita sp.]